MLFLRRFQALNLGLLHTTMLLAPGVKGNVGNGVLTVAHTGREPGVSLMENTDDLFVGNPYLCGCPHVAFEDVTNIGV